MKNWQVLRKGHKKAEKVIKAHLCAVGERFAIRALYEAVKGWDSQRSNLTGNVRTGFCAGVYYDGRLARRPITVFEAEMAIEKPTNHFVNVGDSGFSDYDSGEYIGSAEDPSVKDYTDDNLAFQKVYAGYGYKVTSEWMWSHKPKGMGLVVVIANAVPYAEYLKEARKLDILESSSSGTAVSTNLMGCFREVKFSDYENTGKTYG